MDMLQRMIGGGAPAPASSGGSAPPTSASAPISPSALGAPAAAALPAAAAGAAGAAGGVPAAGDLVSALARVQAIAAQFGSASGAPLLQATGGLPLPVAKLLKEIYVGGLPSGVPLSGPQVRDFFNLVMERAGLARPAAPFSTPGAAGPVANVRLADGAAFCFLEMRSPEEADTVLTLSGLPFLSSPLKLNRPKAYQQSYGAMPSAQAAIQAASGGAPGAGGMAGGLGAFQQAMAVGGMVAGALMAGSGGFAAAAAAAASAGGAGAYPGMPGVPGMTGVGAPPAPAPAPGPATAASILGTSSIVPPPETGKPPAAASPPPPPVPAAPIGIAPDDATPTDVILVAGLPPFIDAEGVKEVVASFGAVALCIELPAPHSTEETKAALVAYDDPESTVEAAIGGLSGLPIGDAIMQLSRAPAGLVAAILGQDCPHLPAALRASVAAAAAASAAPSEPAPTPFLELTNVVVAGDLTDPSEVTEIAEDVAEEAGKYGRVTDVFIPPLSAAQRAGDGAASVPVYVTFDAATGAAACAQGLRGRKFDGRTVSTRFVTADDVQAAREASGAAPGSPPAGADEPDAEGGHGGHGRHFASVAIPPPVSYAPARSSEEQPEQPEDGLTLPPMPSAADLD